MSTPSVSWAPTKKMRLALAGILTADAVQVAGWINDSIEGKYAAAAIILATVGGVAAYLTSDSE